MSDINITVEGNTSKRLKTAGKYCDRDIVVTAEGGGIDTSDATVTENDMPMGVTGYAKGKKVTGNVEVVSGHNELTDAIPEWDDSKGTVSVGFYAQNRVFFELNGNVTLYVKPDKLGDATDDDVTEGKTYTSENGLKRTGTKQAPVSVTQATPTITVDETTGLITAKSTQSAGLVSAGTKQATKQLTTKAAQTYTPGTSALKIMAGRYLTGDQTIKGDANLIAENIKNGISIFGVTGTFAGGGLPDGVSAIASGTVTPAENNTSGVVVNHNLGVVPNFCAWFVEDDYSGNVETSAAIAGSTIVKKQKYTSTSTIVYNVYYLITGYNASSQQAVTYNRVSNATYMTTTQARLVCNSTYQIQAGSRIRWVVGVASGVL